MSLIPAPNDLLNVTFTYANVATPVAMNVLHFRVGSITGPVPSMTDFLTAVAGTLAVSFGGAWRQAASDDVTLISCRATSVFPLPRSVGITSTFVTPLAGDITGEALPLQDSVTILKRTAVGNRWGLGRFFFVGLPEEEQANGIISATEVGNLAPTIAWLATAKTITGSGWSAVLNPCIKRGPEDNPVSITNVLTANLSNTIIKTQRRRRPGKGI